MVPAQEGIYYEQEARDFHHNRSCSCSCSTCRMRIFFLIQFFQQRSKLIRSRSEHDGSSR